MKSMMISILKKDKKDIILIIVFDTILAILGFILSLFLGYSLDVLTISKDYFIIIKISILSIIIYIVTSILKYFNQILTTKYSNNKINEIIDFIIRHMYIRNNQSILNNNSVYLSERINNDCSTIVLFLTGSVKDIIFISFISIMYLVFICTYSIKLFFIFILTIPAYITLYSLFKNKLYNVSFDFKEAKSKYLSRIVERLNLYEFIKSQDIQDSSIKFFNKTYKNILNKAIKLIQTKSLYTISTGAIGTGLSIFLLLYGGKQVIEGKFTIGNLVVINSFFNKLISNVNYFISFTSEYQNVLSSKNRISEILDMPIKEEGEVKINEIYNITISNLSFKYQNKIIINNLHLKFEKNNLYVIKGKSGFGKTTILKILIGIIDNYEGECIYNDKYTNKEIDFNYLRKHSIAYIGQQPYFLEDSLLNNMLYNTLESEELLYSYINYFDLSNKISSLPNNINTIIDNAGTKFSEGEKKRLTIIKGLLKKASVFILDEPDAGLDNKNIEKLNDVLLRNKKNKITIIVTHSDYFDKIYDNLIIFE